MEKVKNIVIIIALVAGILLLLSADAQMGDEACGGERTYNQTTGKCIEK